MQLTDANFTEHIARQVSDRAKASEMEHAIRAHIRKHLDEDPVKYGKLSERLQELLKQSDGQWKEQQAAFAHLIEELEDGAPMAGELASNLPPQCLPFLRLLIQAKLGESNPDAQTMAALEEVTVALL